MNDIKKSVQELVRHITENVRGSGIDGKWREVYHSDKTVIRNSFHCMKDNGMYDGWQAFSVELPANGDVLNFKLRFNEDSYFAQKYKLRDRLGQIFLE